MILIHSQKKKVRASYSWEDKDHDKLIKILRVSNPTHIQLIVMYNLIEF